MGVYSRASNILDQVNTWMNMEGLATVVKRGLFGGPIGAVGIAFVAGVDTVASGIFGVTDAMFGVGEDFFTAVGETFGLIPAGVQGSSAALPNYDILGAPLAFGLVLVIVWMLYYARENWFEDADLPISRVDLPILGEDNDDD